VFSAVSGLLGGCGCRVLLHLVDAGLGRHTCSRQAVHVTVRGSNSCSGVAAAAGRVWWFLVSGRSHLVDAGPVLITDAPVASDRLRPIFLLAIGHRLHHSCSWRDSGPTSTRLRSIPMFDKC
jgi:hypothetical protein